MEKLITWREAEEISGYTARILRKHAREGRLKVFWLNEKEYRTTAVDLEKFRKSQEVLPSDLRRVRV